MSPGGRPTIGPERWTRLSPDTLTRVNEHMRNKNIASEAEALRDLIEAGLRAVGLAPTTLRNYEHWDPSTPVYIAALRKTGQVLRASYTGQPPGSPGAEDYAAWEGVRLISYTDPTTGKDRQRYLVEVSDEMGPSWLDWGDADAALARYTYLVINFFIENGPDPYSGPVHPDDAAYVDQYGQYYIGDQRFLQVCDVEGVPTRSTVTRLQPEPAAR